MNDEKPHESNDNGNIEGGPTGIKIPVRRSDIGPYIKWLVFAIAFGVVVLSIAGAVRLVIGVL